MPITEDDYERDSTYFGVFSASQASNVSELLNGLGVRYRFFREEQTEDRLRAWTAWDPTAQKPHEGHELFIHSSDLGKVGTKIIEMYPERKFMGET